MNDFIDTLQQTLTTFAVYALNGLLAFSYTLWEQKATLLTAGGFLQLLRRAPTVQCPWIAGAGCVAMVAGFLAPMPVPFLLAGMTLAGTLAIIMERFNPDALRWRIVGALTIYSAAALFYLAYSRYLAGVDASAWAEAIGGQGEAQATLSQGRAFLNTLATWGLWLILPLGYASLLIQGVLAHPPLGARPDETIAAVRTRQDNRSIQ